ncbi:amidohydrolase [Bradyrhizobium sp. 193]|uniref:amidohydrolase n=1 Tax=Bradyrhizobium sp. 193 TaxID=2782661 RepID=UPI001FF84EA2|nr:amidohydrolase [Bradyrhizobium sp. 193]MCK1488360.1 amidohydrolase [Bradyrhizobium sp. 193]
MGADTIFHGGTIVTMDRDQMQVEAVAISKGKILAVGSWEAVSRHRGFETTIVDLDGRTMLPGFVEAHGHPLLSALCWGDPVVDIRSVHTPTYEAALAKIRRRVSKAKDGEFLWFLGLDPQLHVGAKEPSKTDLDELSPTIPIAVQVSNMHGIYLNTAALKALKITRETPVVPGGNVRCDENGEPWKFEERSREYVIESFYALCGEQRGVDSLRDWLWKFSKSGYTTSSEMGVTPMTSLFYKKTLEREQMPIRVFCYQRAVPEGIETISFEGGNDRFAMAGIKMWGDGSVLMGNVWLTRPYLNNKITLTSMGLPRDSVGHMNYKPEELKRIIKAYAARGHQMSVHTHGDRTIDAVLDAYELALNEFPEAKRPFRLEHCGTLREDQIDRCNKLGVVCSFFLPYLYYWGEALRDALLGPEAAAKFVPAGSAVRKGMRSSLHCDPPMTWPHALLCLHLATTRRSRAGSVIGPDQIMDIDSALRSVTIDAAFHLRKHNEIGSIEVGKYADFVLLDRNPRTVDPEHVLDLKVLGTYVEGERIWECSANEAASGREAA